jgi:hypothetical protein
LERPSGIGELYARRRLRSSGPADEDEQMTSPVKARRRSLVQDSP